MDLSSIKTIGVIGAGTMGSGIAQIAAMAGYTTKLFDINADAVKKAEQAIIKNLEKGIEKGKVSAEQKEEALSNLSFSNELTDLKADFIIEAVIEKLEVKHDIFSQLEDVNSKS
jgi:3-hydroxybutyryl-CoA dehydrogenase